MPTADDYLRRMQQSSAPAPAPASAGTDGGGRNTARLLAQGAGFGFSDEFVAGVVAALSQLGAAGRRQGFGDVYRDTLEAERAGLREARDEIGGIQSFGVEAAGGLLTGGALSKAARLVGRGSRPLAAAAARLTPGKTAAALTATEGAIAGAGASEGGALDTARGAVLGAGTALATRGVINQAGRTVGARLPQDIAATPRAVGMEIGERAQRLGIRLTGAQQTGRRSAAIAESATRRNIASADFFEQLNADNANRVNELVLRRFGRAGTRVDGDVLDDLRRSVGRQFDDVTEEMSGNVQAAPVTSLQAQRLIAEAEGFVPDVEKPDRLLKAITQVQKLLTKPEGATPKQIGVRISKIRDSAFRASRAGELNDADALTTLYDAVLEAMGANNPSAAARLNDARRAWRDLMVISKPSVTDAVTGKVNPLNLAGELSRSRYTARAFGQSVELDNPIFEIGRLVRQLNDTIQDPGAFVGMSRGSMTPEGLSFSLPNLAGAPMAAAAGRLQTMDPRVVTLLTDRGGQVSARAAALLAGRQSGERSQ